MTKDNNIPQAGKMAMPVLIALSMAHLLNDLVQSVVSAAYPILKADLNLSFAQIGLITLVYQLAASVFQPVVGIVFDHRPKPWCLTLAAALSFAGIIGLAYSESIAAVLVSVFTVGTGSSIVHPEASRITSLASGGRRGLAQSVFQVGGHIGTSIGPLLVALIVAGHSRHNIAIFAVFAVISYITSSPIRRWFAEFITESRTGHRDMKVRECRPLPVSMTVLAILILTVLIFSKYIYMASLTSYYTFYLMEKFGVTVQMSQILLFVFLFATAAGTLVGGPLGDRIGRKYVIWISILGTAPFSLLMPHTGLFGTAVLSFCAGFVLASAFPAILLYAQELLPYRLGLVSGMFFGFSFGVAGIASAVLGSFADDCGIISVYNFCAYMPLAGLVTVFLPDTGKVKG
ncbi:MFS transporter [Xylanibacter muris]|uniref:MFS transporter n=2 Tax=Xylanibacter muris TaxID=2736290 RepID=A0ABX2AQ19_9BACT|nr:MFS transporter [Xylanibacter muris]NPD92122.1 MFS transporter [Xylanibacter muris]